MSLLIPVQHRKDSDPVTFADLKAFDSHIKDRLRGTRDFMKSVRNFVSRICNFDCNELEKIRERLEALERANRG